MKKIFCISFFSAFAFTVMAQSGKYAGSKKSLVGKIYSRDMAGLAEWEALGGSVISAMDDPEMITVDVFKKGTTRIILFCIKEDTASEEFVIADLVEVKNVMDPQEIKTGVCRENKTENPRLIALIRPLKVQYNKAIKAWRFNRDKRRVEIVSAAKADCLYEGFDQE